MNNMKLAIFGSGIGSTAEAIFDKASLVVTNNSNAGIITKAKQAGLDVEVIEREGKSLEQFGEELLQVLRKHQIEFISQNGWELLTPSNVIKEFEGRITNNHPAPLDPGYPDFGGKGMKGLVVHQAVLNFFHKVKRGFNTEVCIHLVTPDLDKGHLLAYEPVEILDNDTAETLQTRVKEIEKKLMMEYWVNVEKDGELVPIQRDARLIKDEEFGILEEAKTEAIADLQKG